MLQGLARCGLLDKFHYLSTVSGGGYIGSWLSAWINRAGLTSVTTQLAYQSEHARPNPEPLEIQNLRSYSNYLTPRLGFFSADSWTLVGTYLRNLLLNWCVIIPLLAAFLALPWIFSSIVMMDPPLRTDALFWSGAALVVIGVAYMGLNLPCGRNLRWNQKRFLLFCLLPLFLASVLMTIYWAWFNYYGRSLIAWPLFGFGQPQTWVPFLYLGIALHIVSWLTSLLPAHGFRTLEFLAVIVSGAIGGVVLWLGAQKLFPHPVMQMELYICLAVPGFMALFFVAIMVFAGISSRWTDDSDREWWGRATGLVARSSSRMAAHQRTGRLRTTFAEVDVVVHHHRRSGRTSYRSGRPQPDGCGERKRTGDRESARSHFVQGIHDRGDGLCGGPINPYHRGNHIGDEEVDSGLSR